MNNMDDEQINGIRTVFEDLGGNAAIERATKEGRSTGSLANQLSRSEILINAMAVFAKKGVAKTTVQDLLTASGISRRTFYKYFSNKVDVLENIYKTSVDLLVARFKDELAGSSDAVKMFDKCISLYLDYHISVGPIIRMMQEEALRSDSPLAPHRRDAQREMVELFAGHVRQLLGKDIDTLVYYTLIWSMESMSLYLLTETDCSEQQLNRAKGIMRQMIVVIVQSPGVDPEINRLPPFGSENTSLASDLPSSSDTIHESPKEYG